MMWGNEQLEAHLNAHRNKVNLAQARRNKENDAKVNERIKTRLKRKLEPFRECEHNLILDGVPEVILEAQAARGVNA